MSRRRPMGDSGATAVLTAILVVILFGFAALAVDLTNQFSRDRASQTTADLAALAGAGDLPEGCVALNTAIAYMTGGNNQILFDEANSGVGLGALTDGVDANGEIRVHDSADIPNFGDDAANPLVGCPGVVNTGNAITVFTPPQEVDFAFAPVLGLVDGTAGPTSGDVGSAATAFREGGFERNLLPFGLPSGCGFGQQVIKAGSKGSTDDTPADCEDSLTGNFGLIESPRRDVLSEAEQRTYNLAFGLDHGIQTFPAPAPDEKCTSDGAPTGAILDDSAMQNTANCLNVLNGGKVSLNMDALIEGNKSIAGRLTRISEPPRDGAGDAFCSEPSGGGNPDSLTDFRWAVPKTKDISITNTVLSCYLDGTTMAALASGSAPAGSVDPAILKDPRFFSVPVLSPLSRAQNGYWPVVEFRAAFITSETSEGNATCVDDTDCNGLRFNTGGKQLEEITVFVFNEAAIPGGGPGGTSGFTSLLR